MPKEENLILVVDAEPQTCGMLGIVLAPEEFVLKECLNGRDAAKLSISLRPDLVLLDLDLPDMQGTDVITALRAWSQAPIIVLTARDSSQDTVRAFNLGADDYVLKPFNMSVLVARSYASLRKSEGKAKGKPELVNGPLRMDLARHEVYLDGKLVNFTPKEYDLLRYFLLHCGKMLTHKELLTEVWGGSKGDDARYLRVFICKIRDKIAAVAAISPLIVTQPGIGYRMEILGSPGEAAAPLQS